jgi:hypothetical protein
MAQSLEESVIQKQLRDLQVTMFRVKVPIFQKIVMFSPFMEFMISEIQSETLLLLTRVNLPYRGSAMTEFCGQQWPI